jgi:hypothetical protein
MSHVNPAEHDAVVVRSADAERVGYPPQMVRLLADSRPPVTEVCAPAGMLRASPVRSGNCATAASRVGD